MFIHDDLVKDVSLACCESNRIGLQMFLIDEIPMRYDLILFQFILNLMEIMCLEQECVNMPSWVVEINYKNW